MALHEFFNVRHEVFFLLKIIIFYPVTMNNSSLYRHSINRSCSHQVQLCTCNCWAYHLRPSLTFHFLCPIHEKYCQGLPFCSSIIYFYCTFYFALLEFLFSFQ